jgi:asparagine synthase (glutamine-hydrolysing)
MCGIFAYLLKNKFLKSNCDERKLEQYSNNISHRGPDSSVFKKINDYLYFGFHRLAINGLDDISNQPFLIGNIALICNGEIYNYKQLIKEYHFELDYETHSDCEIIIHLYKSLGIEKTCKLLDGEFAFILYDIEKDILYASRDQIGVRSLYWNNMEDDIYFCSEMKGLKIEKENNVEQFPVASYWSSDTNKIIMYFDYRMDICYFNDERKIINNIYHLFTKAVEKRLMSERKIACLLSGGLDSTTVTAIVASYFPPNTINTYSIGLKGSVDLHFAKIAADYLKTNHTSVELTNEDFLDAIENTIYQIESYDTTTVRASVGNYLVSLYIKEKTEDTVIFCGDVSDEIFASYRGFTYATNESDLYVENIVMLDNIQYFDVLRSDKSIAGAGLEARVPFSDPEFIKYCMNIHPSQKMFSKDKIEKYLFRKAFQHLLPDELAWRVKTAFSDGVSNVENPWYQIIKDYMDTKYTDDEFNVKKMKYKHNQPYDKESLYYREIYERVYPYTEKTIPYFWKQPFTTESDPSAWVVENKETNCIEQ